MALIVLDTNVLVSGLLSRHGKPAQILDALMFRRTRAAYDRRIMMEYIHVLCRPRFALAPDDIQATLQFIEEAGLKVDPPPLAVDPALIPDPNDLPFAEVAVAAGAILVTGNARHFAFLVPFQVPVLSPAEFLEAHPRGGSDFLK